MVKIEISTEYITLGQFLKFAGIIDSGALAKQFLLEKCVFVNDERENRRGRKLYNNDVVNIDGIKYHISSVFRNVKV